MSTWDSISATWEQLWADTSTGWRYLAKQAEETWADVIREDPERAEDQVEAMARELVQSRANLDRIRAALPPGPSPEREAYLAMEARYQDLAAGFYSDVEPVKAGVGVVPVVIAAGLAVGLGAATWSFAGYEYAVNLREQTALAAQELEARVEASKEGRTLQPTTLPPQGEGGLKLGMLAAGGVLVIAVALVVPSLIARS